MTPWTVACQSPLLHYHPEFAQTHALWASDANQPPHPLLSPSPPALDLSQHQGLFQCIGSSNHVAKVLALQLQLQSFQWMFRVDWSPCCLRNSRESSAASQAISRLVIAILPRSKHLNFVAAVTILIDFAAQENEIWHGFHIFPIYLPLSDRTVCHDAPFWMLSFKSLFHGPISLSSRGSLGL